MDIEHLTHQSYRMSIWIAVVLSGLIVAFASIIGRGTLNLRGALFVDEPTDVTVIALTEPKIGTGASLSKIEFLRKEDTTEGEKPNYAYNIRLSDNRYYLVRIGFDKEHAMWSLLQFEQLRADPLTDGNSSQDAGNE